MSGGGVQVVRGGGLQVALVILVFVVRSAKPVPDDHGTVGVPRIRHGDELLINSRGTVIENQLLILFRDDVGADVLAVVTDVKIPLSDDESDANQSVLVVTVQQLETVADDLVGDEYSGSRFLYLVVGKAESVVKALDVDEFFVTEGNLFFLVLDFLGCHVAMIPSLLMTFVPCRKGDGTLKGYG